MAMARGPARVESGWLRVPASTAHTNSDCLALPQENSNIPLRRALLERQLLERDAQVLAFADLNQQGIAGLLADFDFDIADALAVDANAALRDLSLRVGDRGREVVRRQQ